jgi:hypothetical protein
LFLSFATFYIETQAAREVISGAAYIFVVVVC